VYAFEPLPENLAYLTRHVELNGLKNVTVEPSAVSDVSGTVQFARGSNRSTGGLKSDGNLKVNSIAVDEFVFGRANSAPQVIKIDVEGAEFLVLQGARRVLSEHRPVLYLATHGDEVRRRCCALLMHELNYDCAGLAGERWDQTDELCCRPR